MGHAAVWKVLEAMIADFRKRKAAVPEKVMSDLTSAKIMLNVSKAETHRDETLMQIDVYLENVESYLVSEGEKLFDAAYADEWLKKIQEARKEVGDEQEETRFVLGLPREQKWIRVKSTLELPAEQLKTLAEKTDLVANVQEDGHLLVCGKDEQVKKFVKKMTAKQSSKTGK